MARRRPPREPDSARSGTFDAAVVVARTVREVTMPDSVESDRGLPDTRERCCSGRGVEAIAESGPDALAAIDRLGSSTRCSRSDGGYP